ncbi:hypothetical protein J27TS7_23730 [Paenibacillus dendritiformis]|nr:hypothetical protein J27TS7_23730 [Paenibacillus dendritiformis]
MTKVSFFTGIFMNPRSLIPTWLYVIFEWSNKFERSIGSEYDDPTGPVYH